MGMFDGTVKEQQLRTALYLSANFGTNNNGIDPEDFNDKQACQYLVIAIPERFGLFMNLCAFNNQGQDYEQGKGNLFHIFATVNESDKTANSAFQGHTINSVIEIVQDLFDACAIKGYFIDVDYAAQQADITVRIDPYEDNNRITDISAAPVDNTDGTNNATTNADGTPTSPPGVGTPKVDPANPAPLGKVELADPPSVESRQTVNMSVTDTSEFYRDCILMLEGVQIPYNSISVSYGVNSPPTCTLIIPAHNVIRDLPECTKIHVFFKDLLPDSSGEYKYRLLFDGEMSGYSYNTDSRGAYITMNGIHSCAYTTLMQIMTLDVAQYLFNTSSVIAGNATIPILFGQNRMHSTMIADLLKGKFKTMADLVYQMMRGILEGNDQTGTGKYYASKLGNGAGAWKILKRMYGVSKEVANSKPPQTDWSAQVAKGNDKTNSGTGTSKFDYKGTGNMQRPCAGVITSPFGPREQPTAGASTYHNGIDIGADTGTVVLAADDGIVTVPGYDTDGYGNWIMIDHGSGIGTVYGHLSSIGVTTGQSVTKGQVIGGVGSTGCSSGPHLHFGVSIDGSFKDPMGYIGG